MGLGFSIFGRILAGEQPNRVAKAKVFDHRVFVLPADAVRGALGLGNVFFANLVGGFGRIQLVAMGLRCIGSQLRDGSLSRCELRNFFVSPTDDMAAVPFSGTASEESRKGDLALFLWQTRGNCREYR